MLAPFLLFAAYRSICHGQNWYAVHNKRLPSVNGLFVLVTASDSNSAFASVLLQEFVQPSAYQQHAKIDKYYQQMDFVNYYLIFWSFRGYGRHVHSKKWMLIN